MGKQLIICIMSNWAALIVSIICIFLTCILVLISTIFLLFNCTYPGKYTETMCLTLDVRLSTIVDIIPCGLNCARDITEYYYIFTVKYHFKYDNETYHITDFDSKSYEDKEDLNREYSFYVVNSTFKCYYDNRNTDDISVKSYEQTCYEYWYILGGTITFTVTLYISILIISYIMINIFLKDAKDIPIISSDKSELLSTK